MFAATAAAILLQVNQTAPAIDLTQLANSSEVYQAYQYQAEERISLPESIVELTVARESHIVSLDGSEEVDGRTTVDPHNVFPVTATIKFLGKRPLLSK